MRSPKRIRELLKNRDLFLEQARTKLENTTLRLQTNLFTQIINDIVIRLDIKDGLILDNANNYRLISELDRVYDTFNKKVIETLLPQINKGTEMVVNMSKGYFSVVLSGNLPARFEKILEATRVLTDLRLGIRMGKMIRGGALMSMLRVDPLDFKQLMSKAVTSQMNMKDFVDIVKDNITGSEEKIGLLERQFKSFAYDIYQQYDRGYNKKLANEFGMKYFIYQGGLIIDSRDFCVCHNGKIFSVEEAEEWKKWTPDMCEYPPEHPMQAKEGTKYPPNAVPSYLSILGYSPLDDAGGPRCRHILGFIADELAFRMRPDLKK